MAALGIRALLVEHVALFQLVDQCRRRLPLPDALPGEYVRGVSIAKLRKDQHFRAFKITKRMDEDISAVLGAFNITTDGPRIAAARIAFGGMAGIPARARLSETALIGARLDTPASWKAAIDALAQDFQPIDDHRASAAYRNLIARNLLRKALTEIAGAPLSRTRIVPPREVRDAAE